MKEFPLVSILVANCNNGRFIGETLASAMAQTYPNLEVVVIDDGSTDDSLKVIEEFMSAHADARIRLVKNSDHKGCGRIKRQCVEVSEGEYFCFLDPDDAISPDAVATLMDVYAKHPEYGIVYSTHYLCNEKLEPQSVSTYPGKIPEGQSHLTSTEGHISALALCNRKVYNQTSGIKASYYVAEDQDLYLKMEEVAPVYFVDKPLYYYRHHDTNTSWNEIRKRDNILYRHKVNAAAYRRRCRTHSAPNITRRQYFHDGLSCCLQLHNIRAKNGEYLPFLLSLCMFFVVFPIFFFHDIGKLPSLNYYIGYETGFGGRKLIGTLLHPFLPDYVRHRDILLFVYGANVVLAALFVRFVTLVTPVFSKKNLPALCVLIVYLAGPFSIFQWYVSYMSIWFMETYMMILVLVWLIAYVKKRTVVFGFITVLTATLGILIHDTFACEFFPLFVALFCYDVLSDKTISWKKVVLYVLASAVVLGLFLAIWFCSTMNIDFETLHAEICRRTAPGTCDHSEWSLWVAYYQKGIGLMPKDIHPVFLFFSALALLSPLVAFFLLPWMMSAKASTSFRDKMRYLLPVFFETALTLPIFFILYDHARWWYCWFFCQFAMLMVAIAVKDKLVLLQLRKMLRFFRRHWFLVMSLLFYVILALHPDKWFGLLESIRLRNLLW